MDLGRWRDDKKQEGREKETRELLMDKRIKRGKKEQQKKRGGGG